MSEKSNPKLIPFKPIPYIEESGTSQESPKSSGTKIELKIKEKKLGPSIPEAFLRELRGEAVEEKQAKKRSRNKPGSQQVNNIILS
jgi:hypothetical protein